MDDPMRPVIRKLGTIDCDIVETTPVVFRGRLYRLEYIRYPRYWANDTGDTYFRFVDVETGEKLPAFAAGWHFASAFVDGDFVYVTGVNEWGGRTLQEFRSSDLRTWESWTALDLPGWGIFNTSICRGADHYVLAFEIDSPPEETGVRFTFRFALSDDLRTWRVTPSECVFLKDRYTGGPTLRYVDGWYYLIYLAEQPGPSYVEEIARSRDLRNWELSPLNPLMVFSDEDRIIDSPDMPEDQRAKIASAVNVNNSDMDLCDWQGKTVIYYSWGDQLGIEFLAHAVFDGSMKNLLEGFFPGSSSTEERET